MESITHRDDIREAFDPDDDIIMFLQSVLDVESARKRPSAPSKPSTGTFEGLGDYSVAQDYENAKRTKMSQSSSEETDYQMTTSENTGGAADVSTPSVPAAISDDSGFVVGATAADVSRPSVQAAAASDDSGTVVGADAADVSTQIVPEAVTSDDIGFVVGATAAGVSTPSAPAASKSDNTRYVFSATPMDFSKRSVRAFRPNTLDRSLPSLLTLASPVPVPPCSKPSPPTAATPVSPLSTPSPPSATTTVPPLSIPLILMRHDSGDVVLTPESKTITLKRGDIAAEKVNIIVNTTGSSMNINSGGVSSAISNAAGPGLQQNCKLVLNLMGISNVAAGDFIETGPANLRCKSVFHVVCDTYRGPSSEAHVRSLVQKILQQANQKGSQSIAIPAIGTGTLGFPHNVTASIMYDEVIKFSQQNSGGSLVDIRFVLYPQNQLVFKAFEDEMHSLFQPKPVQSSRASQLFTIPTTLLQQSTQNELVSSLQIGHITVQLKQGDILRQQTDAIVSSVNNLDLEGPLFQGNVKAGGKVIATESQLGKRGYKAVVTSAGHLKVIHIVTPYTAATLNSGVLQALYLADSIGLHSVAFPALGTGSIAVGTAATVLLDSIREFTAYTNTKYLQLVKLIIFQPEMLPVFNGAMKAYERNQQTGSRSQGRGQTTNVSSTWNPMFGQNATSNSFTANLQPMFPPPPPNSFLFQTNGPTAPITSFTANGPTAPSNLFPPPPPINSFPFQTNGPTAPITSFPANGPTTRYNSFPTNVQNTPTNSWPSNGQTIPSNWIEMNGQNFVKVQVVQGSQEFTHVQKTFQQSIRRVATIHQIERIQVLDLYKAYMAKMERIRSVLPAGMQAERILFHGTSADACDKINRHGFNRSYSGKNGTAYGKGTYFAAKAAYSDSYTKPSWPNNFKHVYLCRVLTGEYTQGHQSMISPPPKLNDSTEMYDSVVDNLYDPRIFVVFHDSQAYPEYLISYT